jgi:putative transcriptional regulator
MTNERKKPSRLTNALLETAKDMRDGGILDAASYKKITMRHLGDVGAPAEPLSEDIRVRERRA